MMRLSSQALSIIFFAVVITSQLGSHQAQAERLECTPWGCPFLPLDVVVNEGAHTSLTKLRSLLEGEMENDSPQDGNTDKLDMTEEEALENLLPSGDMDKSTLTLVGDKGGGPHQVNQDRAMIYSPYKIPNNERYDKHTQLLGVFDGHGDGGELTSQHASSELPKLLSEKLGQISSLDDHEAVSKTISDVFVEIDQSDPSKGEGGCTASIVLQIGHKIYVANAGDSVSFIAALIDGQVDVAYQSREDKPDLPDEKARIESMGGYVHIPKNEDEDVPRAYYVDDDGVARYGLAMSRSLGDWSVQGVIPEPIVDVLDVSELIGDTITEYAEACAEAKEEVKGKDVELTCETIDPSDVRLLAMSATDGLMDFLDAEDIASVLAAAFYVEDNPHPHVASEFLILTAAERWDQTYGGEYRDDIALSAFKIYSDDSILSEGAARSEL